MTPDLHLTDEQIDDYLIGDLAAGPAAHLSACDPCLTRVAEFAAPLADFSAASLAWGERRSATLPLRSPEFTRASWSRRLLWVPAAAAALAIGFALPMSRHANAPAIASVTAPATPALSSEDEIARDNQMLQQVDQALNAAVITPAALGLDSSDSPARAHGPHSLQN